MHALLGRGICDFTPCRSCLPDYPGHDQQLGQPLRQLQLLNVLVPGTLCHLVPNVDAEPGGSVLCIRVAEVHGHTSPKLPGARRFPILSRDTRPPGMHLA